MWHDDEGQRAGRVCCVIIVVDARIKYKVFINTNYIRFSLSSKYIYICRERERRVTERERERHVCEIRAIVVRFSKIINLFVTLPVYDYM